MSVSLTPTQTLVLWYLIGNGGSAWLSVIKPRPKSTDRQVLERVGLISTEKREREAAASEKPTKVRGRASRTSKKRKVKVKAAWIEVTEAGWAWANDHLDANLPPKTQSAGPILQVWLTHLHAFLQRQGIALAEVVAPLPIAPEAKPPDRALLEERIRRAYLDSTGGVWKQRVRLSELRRRLDGVTRDSLDAALLSMQRDSRLVLFRLDNQREIRDEDREAAITIGGEPRHVLHMER